MCSIIPNVDMLVQRKWPIWVGNVVYTGGTNEEGNINGLDKALLDHLTSLCA